MSDRSATTEIPADILRVLRVIDWRRVYIDNYGFLRSERWQPEARRRYLALTSETRDVLERAANNACQSRLDRLVRGYLEWKAYTVQR